MRKKQVTDTRETPRRGPHRVRLPGFLPPNTEEVGLGDVIARATRAAGIQPCGGCARRASRLNGWIVFTR
jgi:hypothetical protein